MMILRNEHIFEMKSRPKLPVVRSLYASYVRKKAKRTKEKKGGRKHFRNWELTSCTLLLAIMGTHDLKLNAAKK